MSSGFQPVVEVGIATAVELELPSGKRIRAVAPPVVVATKLAAWLGRGGGDVLTSLDVHDIVVLIDGRPELIDELAAQPEDLRDSVAAELASLREVNYFEYVVQGAVAAYGDVANERATILAERLDAIIARLRPA
jgi:predicted nucleotidyltransferase